MKQVGSSISLSLCNKSYWGQCNLKKKKKKREYPSPCSSNTVTSQTLVSIHYSEVYITIIVQRTVRLTQWYKSYLFSWGTCIFYIEFCLFSKAAPQVIIIKLSLCLPVCNEGMQTQININTQFCLANWCFFFWKHRGLYLAW